MAKKILIIEDEKSIADVLSKKMADCGYIVVNAYDGVDGLNKALDEKPDLILLDIVLPLMDGITFLDKYKQATDFNRAPVLVLSNLDSIDKIEESRKKGAYDYLVKTNWTLDEIVVKVKSIIEG